MSTRAPVEAVLAVEVGAHLVTAILADRSGARMRTEEVAAPSVGGDAVAVAAIRALVGQLVGPTSGSGRRTRVLGGAVILPGIVDTAAGVGVYSAQFGWHNLPLAGLIGGDVGAPVVLDSSVRAAARAEGQQGEARAATDWLYLSVGESIAAAAVINGRIHRGATGAAGELGHLPIYPFGESCSCGQRGCVEAYAATAVVTERYRRVSGRTATIAEIAALVGRDPLADEVWTQAMAALGVALTTYVMTEDPELIVLGGELAGVADVALPALRSELRSRLAWRQPPRLVATSVGPDAALIGAVSLAWAAVG